MVKVPLFHCQAWKLLSQHAYENSYEWNALKLPFTHIKSHSFQKKCWYNSVYTPSDSSDKGIQYSCETDVEIRIVLSFEMSVDSRIQHFLRAIKMKMRRQKNRVQM